MIGLSLIVVIGAQNAFVLKQGLKQQYVFWICMVCALSDSILILMGVLGFSKLMLVYPALLSVARYTGAVFLFVYGIQHFYQSFTATHRLEPASGQENDLWKMILICLALTWLNPHVYLDTLVLIGSVSTQFEAAARLYFALGAIVASWLFFYGLGYGARLLFPLFRNPRAWKLLDFLIGCMMWGIAISLVK